MNFGPPPASSDRVVAEVDGHPIHLSEVADEIRSMPAPPGPNADTFDVLYPAALRRLIEREALVLRAQHSPLAKDPAVQRQMDEAADLALANAYLREATGKMVTNDMLEARYDAAIKGKPGPEEVHAWAIMVPTEAEAQDIINQLAAGADFATLARKYSKDLTDWRGGDLGFVRRDSINSDAAAVLFSLHQGEVTAHPVETSLGWLVLKAGKRRTEPTPSFVAVRDRLQVEAMREQAAVVLQATLQQAKIQAYEINGKHADGPTTNKSPSNN